MVCYRHNQTKNYVDKTVIKLIVNKLYSMQCKHVITEALKHVSLILIILNSKLKLQLNKARFVCCSQWVICIQNKSVEYGI